MRALVAGEPVVVRNPDAVRPWQHVLEPLSGYLQFGAPSCSATASFTRGPGTSGPPARAAIDPCAGWSERFLEAWGSGSWTTPADAVPQPHEAHLLRIDAAKAREQLGWAPVWDAPTAVRNTASWYREYYRAPAEGRELVDHQIKAYEDDARAAGLAWAVSEGRRAST